MVVCVSLSDGVGADLCVYRNDQFSIGLDNGIMIFMIYVIWMDSWVLEKVHDVFLGKI